MTRNLPRDPKDIKTIKQMIVDSLNSESWEVVPYKEICPVSPYSRDPQDYDLCLQHPQWPVAVTQDGVVYFRGCRVKISWCGCVKKAARRQLMTRIRVDLS